MSRDPRLAVASLRCSAAKTRIRAEWTVRTKTRRASKWWSERVGAEARWEKLYQYCIHYDVVEVDLERVMRDFDLCVRLDRRVKLSRGMDASRMMSVTLYERKDPETLWAMFTEGLGNHRDMETVEALRLACMLEAIKEGRRDGDKT